MSQATSIEVVLPERKRSASAMGALSRKPMAEVVIWLDHGDDRRDIVVPARVGRVLKEGGVPLPCEVDDAFDAIHALEGRVCFEMLTEILNRRDHSEGEVRRKLAAYGYRDQEIGPCIERARKLRFLNDDRFCEYFIEERKRRGWGRRKIELELKRREVDIEAIPGYPERFFSEKSDLERARAILAKRSVPEKRGLEKLVRHLLSKGFDYAVAREAADERMEAELD